MSQKLPRLRPGLDVMPSPVPEQPGLLLRDPFRYTETVLIVPPVWVIALPCFDGEQTDLDALEAVYRRIGQMVPRGAFQHLAETLQQEGFLETPEFEARREKKHAEFRDAPERAPAHAGSAYPEDGGEARAILAGYFRDFPSAGSDGLLGIAAPHVSPSGGWNCYAAAYSQVTPSLADRTFVLLGTSHYGQPEKFGFTTKPYVTPLGKAEVNRELHDWLVERAPQAVLREDYCHAIEHSIEFQVLFLQYVMGQPVKVLPILCGPFAESLSGGQPPQSQFFEVLGEMAAQQGEKLFWLLGIDMAHMGARYGDGFQAVAGCGPMEEVAARDQARLERICAGDAAGFYDLVRPNGDDLKWCGYPPLYTLLQSLHGLRGEVLRYEQWNIDPQSVVSFAGMAFHHQDTKSPRTT